MANIDFVLAAILENLFTQRVLVDQSSAEQRKGSLAPGQIDEHIIRSAASALRLPANVSQLLGLRVHIDEFDLVDDPIPASQEATVGIRVSVFHDAKLAVCALMKEKNIRHSKTFLRVSEESLFNRWPLG